MSRVSHLTGITVAQHSSISPLTERERAVIQKGTQVLILSELWDEIESLRFTAFESRREISNAIPLKDVRSEIFREWAELDRRSGRRQGRSHWNHRRKARAAVELLIATAIQQVKCTEQQALNLAPWTLRTYFSPLRYLNTPERGIIVYLADLWEKLGHEVTVSHAARRGAKFRPSAFHAFVESVMRTVPGLQIPDRPQALAKALSRALEHRPPNSGIARTILGRAGWGWRG